MKRVEITWVDAVGQDGWVTEKELLKQKTITHTSIGYLVQDTKEHVTITMSYDPDRESLGAWLLIPRAYIKRIKKL